MKKIQKYKRLSPRRSFETLVGVLNNHQFYIGRSLEIGEGGMRVLNVPVIGEGQNILLTFKIPEDKFRVIKGIIRFQEKTNNKRAAFGVQFSDIQSDVQKAIRNYVASKTIEESQNEIERWEQVNKVRIYEK